MSDYTKPKTFAEEELTYQDLNDINDALEIAIASKYNTADMVSTATGNKGALRDVNGDCAFRDLVNRNMTASGNVTIAGTLGVTGVITATGGLVGAVAGNVTGGLTGGAGDVIRLPNTGVATLGGDTHPLQIGTTAAANLCITKNEIQARNNGASNTLKLNEEGGDVTVGGNSVWHAGNLASIDENPTASTLAKRDINGNLKAVEIVPSKGVGVTYSGSFSATADHNTVYDALKTKILLNGDIIKASGYWGNSLIVALYYAPFPNVTPVVGTIWIKFISGGSISEVQFVDGVTDRIGNYLVVVI
jgi:hypothetical protein